MGTGPTLRVASSGGYKDRPWIPRVWDGIHISAWLRLLAKGRFRLGPMRWGMALIVSMLTVLNSALGLLQWLIYGRRIARTELCDDPIFILGHWRSGTTLLHELLVLDPRNTYPSTYSCFAPNHYLVSRRVFPPMLSVLMPSRRPMDNMAMGWDRPQEDEFALCNMGLPSPYLTIAFPNNEPTLDAEFLTMENAPAAEVSRWKRGFAWFLRCITLADPRRIVLKSPAHTCRIQTLLEMFPRAKFVHIVRDPYVLFPSTVNLWKRLYKDQGFQTPHYKTLEERVYETFRRMYETFERQRHLIPRGNFSEVRYEDLLADPLGQMARIYDELGLGGFDQARPGMAKYLEGQADYQRNRYELSAEARTEIARRWSAYIAKYGYAGNREQDAA
jgi:omega-hydroxy-beta-dihydromenaquinone-9 sulfotransferase